MNCPNCKGQNPEGAAECPHCGLVFAKWQARQGAAAQSPAQPSAAPVPPAPAAPRSGSNFWLGLIGIIIVGLGSWGYIRFQNKPDPNRMVFLRDGAELNWKPGSPAGEIQEYEAGMSTAYGYSIYFPDPLLARGLAKVGLELTIEPEKISRGQEITAGPEPGEAGFSVQYYTAPLGGHLLSYSTGLKGGSAKARFDAFEPRLGGRAKGVILEAKLIGIRESADGGASGPLNTTVEVRNVPFDVVFEPPKIQLR